MRRKLSALLLSLSMVLSTLAPAFTADVSAAESYVVVDDTVTDSTQDHYFTYTEATDANGMTGWAADTKSSISTVGVTNSTGADVAQTQHWVWNTDYSEASKHTYTFTFKGTGVEIIGVKNDDQNTFQMDSEEAETVTITGAANTPVALYTKTGLEEGTHTVSVTLPEGGTGLQVCYAKVYGAEGTTGDETPVTELTTTIPHSKTTGTSNYFTFSESGWSAMGQSSAHVWSDTPSADDPAAIWYEVKFVGHKIDVYSGKNWPHGSVKYYIDGEEVGTFNLYNGSNIDSTLITTISDLSEGEHTFRAEATEAKIIDCAQVVVYHEPYAVTDITLTDESVSLAAGATKQIEYTVTPDYASLTDAVYTSSNEAVATVSAAGLITAVGEGSATITVASESAQISKTVTVSVTATVAGIAGSIVDTDTQWTEDRYDEVKELGTMSASLTAWKNDKAVSELALVSVDSALANVTVTASDLTSGDNTIDAANVTATFIKSTKAYNGSFLGYGSTTRAVPEDNGTNRSESADILYQTTPIAIPFNEVQPVWVEFAIPEDAAAGTYTGTLTVTADGLAAPLVFTYTVEVQDAVLADAEDYTFDIMQWQYPYTSAEYYGVEPFSEEHMEILESSMGIYKEVGGNAITTTFTEEAWSGQTYSANSTHYPSMVKWTKNSDGSFTYDYTDFDTWVSFCKEMGLGDKIVAYGIAPWHGSFTYWTEGATTYTKEAYSVGSTRYVEVWTDFLTDFAAHLTEKGWLENVYIGIDERGVSSSAFDVAEAAGLKTAADIDNITNHWAIAQRVTDLNVGDTAAQNYSAKFAELLEIREAKGYKTTLYSCTEHQPGQFSLSAPVESYWAVLNAGMMGADGFNRWAYDAWVADPLNDTTHNAFEPGDCFVIFPDEKDAENPTSKYSVRLARMAEGVRDVNKLEQIESEIPALSEDVAAVYDNIQYTLRTINYAYMSDSAVADLAAETYSFKEDLNALTEKYIVLKNGGTFDVDSVSIDEGDSTTVEMGGTATLHATLAPENLVNTKVTWTSSNEYVVSVDANGEITGLQPGVATITATSEQDPTKSASILVTVTVVEIDEAKQVAYYSFDNVSGTDLVDEWGDHNGTIAESATTAEGKSGNALSVTAAGEGAAADDYSDLDAGDWTVAYWVKTTSNFTSEISPMEDSTKAYSLSLKMAAAGVDGYTTDRPAGFRVGDGNGDVLTYKNCEFIKDTWYHLTWVQDKDTGLSLYVNGELADTNTWPVSHDIKAPVEVIGGTGFTGLIDEVKVYNAVLNEKEIAALMMIKGINNVESSIEMYLEDTHQLTAYVISDETDKTLTYTSADESIATVDENGLITAVGRGSTTITIKNEAAGYEATVPVKVSVEISILNELDKYILPEEYQSDVDGPYTESGAERRYLGQPDMAQTETGRLITVFPVGHGHGPLVMKYSDDQGETWIEKTDIPESWAESQETPTIYSLKIDDGNGGLKERLMLICACPNWDLQLGGWQFSYSDDNGETWTEFEHVYPTFEDGTKNWTIVAMASLIQLKDEDGNYIQKWMGVYHDYDMVNYKTYLTFDSEGNAQWTYPVPYLSEYRSIESSHKICEVGMFRSPDGERIVALARNQSHTGPATMFYSDDEGETWTEPVELPGSLAGERHKALYDPVSGKLVITFREIIYDRDGNGVYEPSASLGDWTAGDWVAWVGDYEDIMNLQQGDYMIVLDEDFAGNTYSGDTGYTGMAVLEDGTFVLHSYGHWDESSRYVSNVTTDLCWIRQAKFTLAEIEENMSKPVEPEDPEVPVADKVAIPAESMTVSASSTDETEPAYNKDPQNAIDGDEVTFWATVPGGTLEEAYYVIELDDVYKIKQIDYTQRYDANAGYNCTGNLLDYIIEVSTDGETWTQVAAGDTVDGTTEIKFDPVEAKYVRVTATESYHWQESSLNTVMTIAELFVYEVVEEPVELPLESIVATTSGNEELNGGAAEGPAELATDGDESTKWHTEWYPEDGNTYDDHWLQLELDGVYSVSGFKYLPRQDSSANGDITGYQILVSMDGVNWTVAAEGTWEFSKDWQEASFEAQNAKYVRLQPTASLGDQPTKHFSAAAEVRVMGLKTDEEVPTTPVVDRTALEAAIATAEALNAEDYTEESWNALQEVIAALEFLPEEPTQEVIDNATEEIINAIAALEEKTAADEVVRISGKTRYETGYKVADFLQQTLGVELFDAVVVATGKNFADALAGSYLAVEKNAPILLTNGKDDNIAELHTYIRANVALGGKVYILGGEGAVPASVEAIDGYDVVRLSGKSRYETNLAILEEAGVAGDELIVATGKTFADSLSASAAKLPILLVKPGEALSAEAKAIAEGMKKFYIIGGEGAVSAEIEAELAAYGEVVRVSGKTRYETSVAVANTFFTDVEEAVVANGKNFPDGLCGGPLAAAMNAPLILTADGKTDAAAAYLAENAVASGFVLGGTGALADESVVDVFALESADEIIVR